VEPIKVDLFVSHGQNIEVK